MALEAGAQASYLVDYASQIKDEWFEGVNTVGVTSGASVPEILVKELVEELGRRGYSDAEEVTTTVETITFSLPRDLRLPRRETPAVAQG